MPTAFLLLDREWRIAFANAAAGNLLGKTELGDKNFWVEFPELLGSRLESDLRDALATVKSLKVTFQHAPSGRSIEGDVFSSAAGIAMHLRTGSHPPPMMARVMDRLEDAILLLDSDWRIVYANQTARRISRIREQDIQSETLWTLYPELVGTPLERAYYEVAEFHEERRVDAFYYEPFQTWFEIRILPAGAGVAVHYRDVTAVRLAETARDAAAQKLQQVFDATTDAIASIDREWRITFLNRQAQALLGEQDQVLETNLWERFPGTVYHGSPFVQHYTRAMEDGVAGSFEAYYAEPLNLWLQVLATPSRDGIIVFFRDVTQRRLQEDALRASEERYRALTELSPQALWTADAEGRVLYANQRFLEYIGQDFVPGDGTAYLQLFQEQDRERVARVWAHSVNTGEEYMVDARLIRAADGAARWWHLRALPIHEETGEIRQWLGVATDVHETRLAADQLREQYAEIDRRRRELETIYSGSPIGMALYEPEELRLLRLNERQADILGLHPEEAIGKRFQELVADIDGPLELMRRAAKGEAMLHQQAEGVLPTRPDEYRYFDVNYSPIFAEDGSVQAIASATIETTQQKRSEAALLQSEKLAAVGRLASSIAHEINNPLESVMNLIYLARQYAVQPNVKELLETADQELRRVSIIANQTLRFHKQATNPQAISCDELLSTVLSIYEGKLKNSGIEVERRSREEHAVVCFEGDIRQVLNNLVANAIDAMPKGGRLLIRSREGTDWRSGRQGTFLTIADTGMGIDHKTQARIFEAFFTTKGISGTGLGLWVSAEIMERHRGRILLRSRQDGGRKGTVLSLFLPFQSSAQRMSSRESVTLVS